MKYNYPTSNLFANQMSPEKGQYFTISTEGVQQVHNSLR